MSTIRLPAPHPGQVRVLREAARFNVVCCGRRWGKSVLGIDRLIQPALAGQPVAWFSPTYKMLAEIWRTVRAVLAPVTALRDAQQHRLELATGGTVDMWSLTNADAVRGRKYARVVIDEAAMVRELGAAWQEVIRPTLTDLRGDGWLLSTPKGRNFFWECWQRGQDPQEPEWMSWQMPTATNPYIAPEELESARRALPALVFQQEYLAAFLEADGAVFRRILPAATAEPQARAIPGHSYVLGVDWARSGDYSVMTVIDATLKAQVALERFTDVEFELQLGRLVGLYERYKPQVIVGEQNSLGLPLIERLQRMGLPVVGFVTSNASKARVVDALALAFEREELAILNDPVQIAELQAYEATRLPSGLIRYSAPEGWHDDTVIALALAWDAATGGVLEGRLAW